MKKVIILLIAVLLLCSIPDAFALDSIVIADNKECTSSNDIAAEYNSLKTELASKRKSFEKTEVYEERIKQCQANLSSFLSTVYEGRFDLDEVSMDWTSNRLITKRELPFEFTGGEEGCRELVVATVLPHLRLRELITFKKFISYFITFKLDEHCVMQFLNLKVVYRGKEVLNEMSLSSISMFESCRPGSILSGVRTPS